jgi:hypothetical protein
MGAPGRRSQDDRAPGSPKEVSSIFGPKVRSGAVSRRESGIKLPHGRKRYLIKFTPPELMSETVEAAEVEIHGDHLVFLNGRGCLAGMFLFDIVEGYCELGTRPRKAAELRSSSKLKSELGSKLWGNVNRHQVNKVRKDEKSSPTTHPRDRKSQ